MRKRKPKFTLDFGNGVEIQTMEELRENFSLKKVMDYFKNRRLMAWLEDRFYSDEADAIKALRPTDSNVPQKICEALGVDYDEYAEELDDAETVAWRQKRREKLRKYTDNERIIKRVDYVAFDQEDLEDIMRDAFLPNIIYLCDNFFRFPSGMLRKTNIDYVGLGRVAIKIDSQKPIDFRKLNISFRNIKFVDDEQEFFREEKPAEEVAPVVEEKKVAPEPQLPTIRLSDSQMILADSLNPAAIAQTAMKFKSRISIKHEGKFIDAKSVNMLKIRGLTKGTYVTVKAEGVDAEEAMKTLIELLQKGWQKNSSGS